MAQLGFVGIFRMSMENYSRIIVGLPSPELLFREETHHYPKGQMIMTTLPKMMAKNYTNVVVIIFTMNVLDSNRPLKVAMVDVGEMVGVVISMVEEMVTMEEAVMFQIAISPMIDVMVTINLWPLGNIFILLTKIQPLRFLVQPGSSAKIVSALLRARLGFIIAPTLPLKIMLIIPKYTLPSKNMTTLPL